MISLIFSLGTYIILILQEKSDGHQQFFAIVQLIGTRKQAENFAYRCVAFLFQLDCAKMIIYTTQGVREKNTFSSFVKQPGGI